MRISDWSSDVCSSDLEFLMHDTSKVNDDLIAARQAIYSQPGYVDTMRGILCLQEMPIRRRNMITAEQYGSIRAPDLAVWTSHHPTATPQEGKQVADKNHGAQYDVLHQCGPVPKFMDTEALN